MKNVFEYMIEIITAIRDGKTIQYLDQTSTWVNCDDRHLPCFDEFKYRIKPKITCYKVALFKDGKDFCYPMLVTNDEVAERIENDDGAFVRWLTDWVEYDTGMGTHRKYRDNIVSPKY